MRARRSVNHRPRVPPALPRGPSRPPSPFPGGRPAAGAAPPPQGKGKRKRSAVPLRSGAAAGLGAAGARSAPGGGTPPERPRELPPWSTPGSFPPPELPARSSPPGASPPRRREVSGAFRRCLGIPRGLRGGGSWGSGGPRGPAPRGGERRVGMSREGAACGRGAGPSPAGGSAYASIGTGGWVPAGRGSLRGMEGSRCLQLPSGPLSALLLLRPGQVRVWGK